MNKKEKIKQLKSKRGITLIALVVTIIVLIILAAVSISLILGDDGIITKAKEAKQNTELAKIEEKEQLNEIVEYLEDLGESSIPIKTEIPVKSEVEAFSRQNGVIEIEFLKGTGYKITSTPNAPKLATNMKKVYWEDDGTEKIEGQEGFNDSKWYSYEVQTGNTENGGTSKWANSVTVDNEGNITGYFVWIPRYAYRIVYFDTEEHENAYRLTGVAEGIVGYSDSRGFVHPDGKTPLDMENPVTSIAVGEKKLRPHPAFENGTLTGYTQGEWNTTLEGIWIAKYEASGTSDELKSVPGVKSLNIIETGDAYTYALGFDEINKSHMLKNSEWGAITYITDSKYGRNGTTVSKNTNSDFYTAGENGVTVKSNPLQSTTGNYYGIYDTVGGRVEYVASYIADNSSVYGYPFASIDGKLNSKTTSTEYATVYDILSINASKYQNYIKNINQKFGDAIIETSTYSEGDNSWNLQSSSFVGTGAGNVKCPFFIRGGGYRNNVSGSFWFFTNNGHGGGCLRICIVVE